MTRMPLEVGSLFRTLTYLLASIYRFYALASVSKAAARSKFLPTRKEYLQQVDMWRDLRREKLLF